MIPKEVPFIDIHTHRDSSGWIASAKDLAMTYPSLLLSYGLHPWNFDGYVIASEAKQPTPTRLETLLKENRIVAIGETGLDKMHPDSYAFQLESFEQHILLSEQYQKPLIIHNVRATADILRLHKKHRPKQAWILHGFNGSETEIRQLTDRGIYLSVGKSLFYPNRKITQSIPSVPLEYLFLETDTSEKTIQEVYEKASELLNMPLNRLKEQIFANFVGLWKTGNNVPDCSSATMALINLDEAMCS